MIRFKCPNCHAEYEEVDDLRGAKVACETCKTRFYVPEEGHEAKLVPLKCKSAYNHVPEPDCSKSIERNTQWYRRKESLQIELTILGCIAVLTGLGIAIITHNYGLALILGAIGISFITQKIISKAMIQTYHFLDVAIATDAVTKKKFIIMNVVCLLSMAVPLGLLVVFLPMVSLSIKIIIAIGLLVVIHGLFFAGIKLFPKLKPDDNAQNEFEQVKKDFPQLYKKATNLLAVISVYYLWVKKYIKISLRGCFVAGIAISLSLSTLATIFLQRIILDSEADRIRHELFFGEEASFDTCINAIVAIDIWYDKYFLQYYDSRDLNEDSKEAKKEAKYFHDMAVRYLTKRILDIAPEYEEYDREKQQRKVKPEIFKRVLKAMGSKYYMCE